MPYIPPIHSEIRLKLSNTELGSRNSYCLNKSNPSGFLAHLILYICRRRTVCGLMRFSFVIINYYWISINDTSVTLYLQKPINTWQQGQVLWISLEQRMKCKPETVVQRGFPTIRWMEYSHRIRKVAGTTITDIIKCAKLMKTEHRKMGVDSTAKACVFVSHIRFVLQAVRNCHHHIGIPNWPLSQTFINS